MKKSSKRKKNHWMITLLLWAALTGSVSGEVVCGRVFSDTNGDGKLTPGEQTLSGLMISDGVTVVKSDEEGRYVLDVSESQRSIFIHMPAKYRSRKWFYRLPAEKSASLDFALTEVPVKDTVAFAQISDEECGAFDGGWFEALCRIAKQDELDFVISTGDLCYINGLRVHAEKFLPEYLGTDTFIAVGNHDLINGENGEDYASLLYPYWYSFERGNILFFVAPMHYGDIPIPYKLESFGDYVKQILSEFPEDKPIIVFSHDLLDFSDECEIASSKGAFSLADYNLKGWFFGHWHSSLVKKTSFGALYFSTANPNKGGIDHSPSSIRLATVQADGTISSQLRYTLMDHHVIAAPLTIDENGNLAVSLVAYDSVSPVISVTGKFLMADGKTSTEFKFVPGSTPWLWNAVVPPPPEETSSGKLSLTVVWKNGNTSEHRQDIVFPKREHFASPVGEWSNFQGSAEHNGFLPESKINTLQTVWIAELEGESFLGSPVVVDGVVYGATIDLSNGNQGGVSAFDAVTGRKLWRYENTNSIRNSMAYGKGMLFFIDMGGDIVALDAKNGREVWRSAAIREGIPPACGGVVYQDGYVYGGTSQDLRKIQVHDDGTFTEIWRNMDWAGGEGTADIPTLIENYVLTSAFWNGYYVTDKETGKCIQAFTEVADRYHSGTFTAVGDRVYYNDGNHMYYRTLPNGRVVSSSEVWALQSSGAPVVTDTLVIFTTVRDGLVALDKETLELRWCFAEVKPGLFDTSPYAWEAATAEGSPVVTGDTVWFGANDGFFYGVALSDGTLRQKINLGAPILSSPAVAGNWIYLTDFAGRMIALRGQE